MATVFTIRYEITPDDMAEARNRSVGRRVARILGAVFVGLLGVFLLYWHFALNFAGWHLFWKYWQVHLMISALGTFFLWTATECVGLNWFLGRFTGSVGPYEVTFRGDLITITRDKRISTVRWLRDRGCVETANLILLCVERAGRLFIVPKRALPKEQARQLRELLNRADEDAQFVATFVLTEADFLDATRCAANPLSSTSARAVMRVLCGLAAVFVLYLPASGVFKDVPNGWAGLWRIYPAGAVFWVAFSGFLFWAAAGQPGLKSLIRHLNHYGQQRIYTFSDAGIQLRRENLSRYHSWKRIFNFRETTNAFVLQSHSGFTCHVIPKSSLAPCDVEQFRNFLLTKVPQL